MFHSMFWHPMHLPSSQSYSTGLRGTDPFSMINDSTLLVTRLPTWHLLIALLKLFPE
jgi:hypothetical protein